MATVSYMDIRQHIFILIPDLSYESVVSFISSIYMELSKDDCMCSMLQKDINTYSSL